MTDQPPAAYVAARRVGDATITIISEATAVGSVNLPILEAEWRRRAIGTIEQLGLLELIHDQREVVLGSP